MNALQNRKNIVLNFYNSLSLFEIDEFDELKIVLKKDDELKIVLKMDGRIEFYKKLVGVYNIVRSGINEQWNTKDSETSHQIEMMGLVMVLDGNNKFSMISAGNEEWAKVVKKTRSVSHGITFDPKYQLFTETYYDIDTALNFTYNKLPSSEEEHFQSMTNNDLVLDFEECINIEKMSKIIRSIGEVVVVSPQLKINLIFKENLRNGA
ncbi:hypothetical protein [Yersinia phage fHe-Yen9-03]|uniref:Uncharacterized protein n=1 Tax=Yersinia phage fHe-Yen9-03 TaxID=2052743 RepID=A0A2C9CZC3_9CAUD|nr:hypothetical protein [Yersinia phage fHe-Yen9-03]